MPQITLTECPRDAMQGIKTFIPTHLKADYLNALLQVGFDILDFGSFVSPQAIPQLSDTAEVLRLLQPSHTKLLAIVANLRGAQEAAMHDQIDFLGFPFSVSPTFQLRNTNATPEQALERITQIQTLCIQKNKQLVVYLGMAFGNPYHDDYNAETIHNWTEKLVNLGIKRLLFADTIGVSDAQSIEFLYKNIVPMYPNVDFGVHLHSTPHTSATKIEASYHAGCQWFDAALLGYGGCPMATDALTGNIATEVLVQFLQKKQALSAHFNPKALEIAIQKAQQLFGHYH